MPSIFLRDGTSYLAMSETAYAAEDVLQQLIEHHPEILAGDDATHGRLVLVRREAGVTDREAAAARWSLDHLYLDARGVPTLVEVKRSSDTRSRREVVAQMLDYAANAKTSFSAAGMIEWLEETARQRGSTGADVLREAFGVEDIGDYWQTVATNLEAERFRLVFVSDSIGSELRRIIEFLNSQMSQTEVLAIEIKQYTDPAGAHQTIVPRVIGDTSEARAAKGPSRRSSRLDREILLGRLRERSPATADAAGCILDWAHGKPGLDVRYARNSVAVGSGGRGLLRLGETGEVELSLETLIQHGEPWDEEHIEELVRELGGLGVHLSPHLRKYPRAPLQPLADATRRHEFLAVMERVLDSLTEPPPY
jgi:hypothetical protein